jgi:hypothetical protein
MTRVTPRSSPLQTSPVADELRSYELPGVGHRDYHFPTRFKQVDVLSAQLLLSSRDVARWLPSGLKPQSFAGVTRAQVTVQHLGQPPDGMKPYTEASFSVRVKDASGAEGWHTLTMPVDSFENRQRGRFIFGYPKEMASLFMEEKPGARRGRVLGEDGAEWLTLEVNTRNPVTLQKTVNNRNLQNLEGESVELAASAEGRMRLGPARVTFGPELRRRYPGLPEHPRVLLGAALEHSNVALSLPKPSGR